MFDFFYRRTSCGDDALKRIHVKHNEQENKLACIFRRHKRSLLFSLLILTITSLCFDRNWMQLKDNRNFDFYMFKDNSPRKFRQAEKWMSLLSTAEVNGSLYAIAIPGSHNSFSYTVTPESDTAEDLPKIFQFSWTKYFNDILYKWSRTQDLNVTEQLMIGVRYFDCRVAWRESNRETLYFVHGLTGDVIDKHLKELNIFLERHPQEVVILDFNHFYGFSQRSLDLLERKLNSILPEKLMSFDESLSHNLSLRRMWTDRKQVIMFCYVEGRIQSKFRWPYSLLDSPYEKLSDPNKILQLLSNQVCDSTGFCVYQGVLNPSYWNILKYVTGSLKNNVASVFIPRFIRWLHKMNWRSKPKGIFITDYVNMANFTQTVIDLNSSRKYAQEAC